MSRRRALQRALGRRVARLPKRARGLLRRSNRKHARRAAAAGARVRVAAALDGAREAVVAALDRPLERVAPGHYRLSRVARDGVAGRPWIAALSALVAGVAGVFVGVLRRR